MFGLYSPIPHSPQTPNPKSKVPTPQSANTVHDRHLGAPAEWECLAKFCDAILSVIVVFGI